MIAIVVPYYNLTYFEETILSLSNQTDKRFNLYIFNDNSPNDPTPVLNKYQNQLHFEYFKFENNLGGSSLVEHWERCLSKTQDEEWIMILGDDDYLDVNVIESWYKNFDAFNNQSNLVRFASKTINEKTKIVSNTYTHPKFENAADSYFRRLNGITRSTLSEYIFSRESYTKFKFHNFPLAWHTDDMAWLEFTNSKPIYSINEANLNIRVSDINISGKQNNLDRKNIATHLFYENLVIAKKHLFSKEQKNVLFLNYEIAVKRNRKLNATEWKRLFGCYFSNFQVVPLIKFVRRFLISQIK